MRRFRNGLIAVGAGDIAAAHKHAAAVNRLAPARTAGAAAQRAIGAALPATAKRAERTFRAMASRADTKALGLHGLFIEARRRNDLASARAYAEEAARTAPSLGWAGRAVLEARCQAGDWAGALALLERNKARTLDKDDLSPPTRGAAHRPRARASEDTDRDAPRRMALEAQSWRRLWCRRRRSPARLACRRRPVAQGKRASSTRPGAPIRIPNLAQAYSRTALRRIRARQAQTHRSSGEAKRPAISKARWRPRAPRSTRRNSPKRAPRSRPISPRRPSASRC